MNQLLNNKIAVVTGASSGIGAAIAKMLIEKGCIVIGLARRIEKMENDVRPSIAKEYSKNFYTLQCDVIDEPCVIKTFALIEQKFGRIDILVNNAGILRTQSLVEPDNSQSMRDTMNTNVMGVVWCTREAFRIMKKHNCHGHVILINSYMGHYVPSVRRFSFNIYAASKHALRAMSEVYRQEFLRYGTKIKITNISPATVHTELMGEGFKYREGIPKLSSEDVANAVLYCLQTPQHVQINEILMTAISKL